jgi:hypothetical protein
MITTTPTTAETITKELLNSGLLPLFEIEVIDNRTGDKDHIIFEIFLPITGNTIKAQHVALTREQEESNKIAFVSIEIYEDHTTDTHLQELFEECTNAILQSDFYTLAD